MIINSFYATFSEQIPALEFVHLRDTFDEYSGYVETPSAGTPAVSNASREAGAHLSQLEMSAGFQPWLPAGINARRHSAGSAGRDARHSKPCRILVE